MKRLAAVSFVVLLVIAGWATYQDVSRKPAVSLANVMPQDALLFMQAKDFGSLLREWDSSPEKRAWLKTDNYEVFSRSRLFLRLQQAQSEFAAAAGLPPDVSFLREVSGEQSALGIYDIGKLELLYITRTPADDAAKSGIWQQRSRFETREVEGRKFYVRTDPQSERVVAFAIDGDYLVLGTREDLVAGALSLMAGKKSTALGQQGWFVDALKSARDEGELRVVVHLAEVTKTPQFRTYWVQQNITELRQYESSVNDLFRTAESYREERSLLLKSAAEDATKSSSDTADEAAALVRLVPPDTGFYRAWAGPKAADAVAMIEQKVLIPRVAPTGVTKYAPNVYSGEQAVGSAVNLETRIDTPPEKVDNAGAGDERLKQIVERANVRAALELHNSEAAKDGVFVHIHSTVVLRAATDWDERAAMEAVQRAIAPGMTASGLGVAWKKAGSGQQSYFELDGLARVFVAVRGKELFVGNDANGLQAALERVSQQTKNDAAIYYAGLNHGRERQNFARLTTLIDRPNRSADIGNADRMPQFFSQNVASLSDALAGVKSESVVIRRSGRTETQTVLYEWAR